jgi:hypothetical protein
MNTDVAFVPLFGTFLSEDPQKESKCFVFIKALTEVFLHTSRFLLTLWHVIFHRYISANLASQPSARTHSLSDMAAASSSVRRVLQISNPTAHPPLSERLFAEA